MLGEGLVSRRWARRCLRRGVRLGWRGVGASGVKIWRRRCRYWSVLVRPVLLCSSGEVGPASVLLCSSGEVGPVPVAVRIWGVASPLVRHPCVGGCWI
jgi:hypothetical protein